MRILMVASEALPFAKTGGLADVLGALPRALARLGHEVDVVIPRYRGITAGEPIGRVSVPLGRQVTDAEVFATTTRRRPHRVRRACRLLRPRLSVWDRRSRLCGQCGALCVPRRAPPWSGRPRSRAYDVVHAHDWQAGPRAGAAPHGVRRPRLAGDPAGRLHHPQPGVPRNLRRELAPAAGARLGAAARRCAGVLGPHQLPQGWHHVQPHDHDRQPHLCPRNPDARVRLRVRRHPAVPRRGPRGNPERNRLRSVGSGA